MYTHTHTQTHTHTHTHHTHTHTHISIHTHTHTHTHTQGRPSTELVTKWGADCERFPESPWRVDHEGTKVTAPERELRRRTCNLAGSNVIFDGYIFQLQGGRLQGGVSKMWAEIVPHMARAVTMHGGEFTQCVYSQRVDLRHAKSTNCGHALTGVPQLPGTQKVFSARTTGSYIRIHTKTNRQTDTYTHTHTHTGVFQLVLPGCIGRVLYTCGI